MKNPSFKSRVEPRAPNPARPHGTPPVCHPERRHSSGGLCAKCYAAWHYATNLETRKAQMKAAHQARKALHPAQRAATLARPGMSLAGPLVGAGKSREKPNALTFFAKRSGK